MEGNSIKSFENLCKIFEMRIKLDKERNIKTPSDVIDNYEKQVRRIVYVNNNYYALSYVDVKVANMDSLEVVKDIDI